MEYQLVTAEASPRILLQPIAAPSILGLYGFAGTTFIVAAHMAGWFGGAHADLYIFPFAALFGGLAQFLAGMWSYMLGTDLRRPCMGCGDHSGWDTAY